MKIIRMTQGDWGKIKALFTVSVENDTISIDGFKLIEKDDGEQFVGLPSKKDKNDEWKNTITIDKEKRNDLEMKAKEYYKRIDSVDYSENNKGNY